MVLSLDAVFETLPLLIPDLRKKMVYLLIPVLETCASTQLTEQSYSVS